MAGPVFPNVPSIPGVPSVQRGLTNPGTDTVPKASSDSITVTATAKDQWGIYTTAGAKALNVDSVLSIGYDAEHVISDFPIEKGGFETYNKVARPAESRVVVTKGGTVEERRAFLSKLDDLSKDLVLYNVVTPERSYLNVNFSRIVIDRSREQGAGLITVEISLREIRQNVKVTFSTTKEPASADPVSNGHVQPSASAVDTSGVK